MADIGPGDRAALTPHQRNNLAAKEKKIIKMLADGSAGRNDIAIFAVDRSEKGNFGCPIHLNASPTLTTRNRYLYALRVGEASKLQENRSVSRLLTPIPELNRGVRNVRSGFVFGSFWGLSWGAGLFRWGYEYLAVLARVPKHCPICCEPSVKLWSSSGCISKACPGP